MTLNCRCTLELLRELKKTPMSRPTPRNCDFIALTQGPGIDLFFKSSPSDSNMQPGGEPLYFKLIQPFGTITVLKLINMLFAF